MDKRRSQLAVVNGIFMLRLVGRLIGLHEREKKRYNLLNLFVDVIVPFYHHLQSAWQLNLITNTCKIRCKSIFTTFKIYCFGQLDINFNLFTFSVEFFVFRLHSARSAVCN